LSKKAKFTRETIKAECCRHYAKIKALNLDTLNLYVTVRTRIWSGRVRTKEFLVRTRPDQDRWYQSIQLDIFSLGCVWTKVLGPKASGTQGYQLISQLEVKQRIKIK